MKYYWIWTGSVTPNTWPVGEIVYIILFYVHDNAFASHRSPMTIYTKSKLEQWGMAKFCERLYEYTKLVKYYWISDTKYVASGVNCLYSSLLCSWQYICITQKPHDHLYKKSEQWGIAKFCTRLHVRIYETHEILLNQWHQIRCQWG